MDGSSCIALSDCDAIVGAEAEGDRCQCKEGTHPGLGDNASICFCNEATLNGATCQNTDDG